jgi:hypothetical protein
VSATSAATDPRLDLACDQTGAGAEQVIGLATAALVDDANTAHTRANEFAADDRGLDAEVRLSPTQSCSPAVVRGCACDDITRAQRRWRFGRNTGSQ